MPACLQFVRKVWSDMLANGGVERVLVPRLQITHAAPGCVRAALDIEQPHLNRMGIMHGGVISTLVDIGGSLAVASHDRFKTGVSTDISTTMMSAGGRLGDRIELVCRTDKMGRTMAFTSVDVLREGRLVARGSHTKYVSN